MKTFIALVLILAGTIHYISAHEEQASMLICEDYMAEENPAVFWPMCDDFWKANPDAYRDF